MTTTRPRPRSSLAHGPDDDCPSCRDCPSCDGGSGAIPTQYRIERHGEPGQGALLIVCTRCDGAAITCPNYVPDPPPEVTP